MGPVTIGADIGQRHDPTAVAVVELEWRGARRRDRDDHYIVRHLERLPLGTPYPDVAERLRAIVAGVRARTTPIREPLGGGQYLYHGERAPHVALFLDATGVGQPVADLLARAGVRPTACYFTHGDRRTEERGRVTIGKAWLVSRLQALAQTHRLHLPTTAEAEATRRELLDYEIRVDANANDTYGAFRVGAHDDLVTAIGLAVQPARSRTLVTF